MDWRWVKLMLLPVYPTRATAWNDEAQPGLPACVPQEHSLLPRFLRQAPEFSKRSSDQDPKCALHKRVRLVRRLQLPDIVSA